MDEPRGSDLVERVKGRAGGSGTRRQLEVLWPKDLQRSGSFVPC
jgi:hypothetical protein